ncbi:MAG: helix-turn-helix domain-containing protein, partial [Desulfitobacteriaceae bacterium]
MEKQFRYTIQSANRTMEILEECVKRGSVIRIKDLSTTLKMGKSNVHRFLATLEMRGYIEKTGVRGEYQLTSKLYELGNQSM